VYTKVEYVPSPNLAHSASLSASGSKATTATNNKAGNTGSKPASGSTAPAPVSEEENLTKKVKSTLRDAEKKTVLFNLNLGKNPVMNKETISRKVTETLCAAVKSGKHDYDIKDAEEVLDDILSCSKLEFLGSSTMRFTNDSNPNDTRNGMHTIPVRMDFKDRDTRFEAEIMLRKLCKVSCSVPYPKRMRTLLNNMVKQGKSLQPDCYIRTKVNVDKLVVEAHAKTASGWLDLGIKQSIPLDILDRNININTTSYSQMVTDSQEQAL
jgi:hypothetical protein